MLTFKLL